MAGRLLFRLLVSFMDFRHCTTVMKIDLFICPDKKVKRITQSQRRDKEAAVSTKDCMSGWKTRKNTYTQERPAVADKPARRLRNVCTVYVRAGASIPLTQIDANSPSPPFHSSFPFPSLPSSLPFHPSFPSPIPLFLFPSSLFPLFSFPFPLPRSAPPEIGKGFGGAL